MTENYEAHLKRLTKMLGSDRGFFILATHSFIEHYIKKNFPRFNDNFRYTSFNENLFDYRDYLKQNQGYLQDYLWNTFRNIADQRELTNKVRHDFSDAGVEDIQIATSNILGFCKAVGIDSIHLPLLEENLDIWKDKTSLIELSRELKDIKFKLHMTTRERKALTQEIEQFETLQREMEHYNSQIKAKNAELELMKKTADDRKERIDELRQQRNDWKLRRNETEEKLRELENVDQYLKNLLHMTLFSRTRLDYERNLLQLTAEQQSVLESISLKNDFLIKGGAGTGKTLVLLEALKRVNRGELHMTHRRILLLTYTTTLVKYDKYLSKIMEIEEGEKAIQTSDSYLNQFCNQIGEASLNYYILKELLKEVKHSQLNAKEIHRELEDFIYSFGITREEYIEEMIPRKGLKTALNRDSREELWNIKEELEELMQAQKKISKGLSRLRIWQALEAGTLTVSSPPDFIFIDESQDLSPMELKILKRIAGTALIMAGDLDQTIYGIRSPFKRAGIDLQGKTRILKHNYRNTLPIHLLAEQFRQDSVEPDREITPAAFREGPMPELFSSEDTEELYELLLKKLKVFIHTLDYDPENICILAPHKKYLEKITLRLKEEGFSGRNIKEDSFDFEEDKGIRLSTFHSCKGLDMPVVLLFMPRLNYQSDLSEESARNQMQNLVYVAMTRAMEHLNLFLKENSGDPLMEQLIDLMEKKE